MGKLDEKLNWMLPMEFTQSLLDSGREVPRTFWGKVEEYRQRNPEAALFVAVITTTSHVHARVHDFSTGEDFKEVDEGQVVASHRIGIPRNQRSGTHTKNPSEAAA